MPESIDRENKIRAQAAWRQQQAEAIRQAGTPKDQAARDARQNAEAALRGARAHLARLQYSERNQNWPAAVQRAERAVADAEAVARQHGITV